MADYIIQKAVNADKVIKKNQRTLAEYAEKYEAQHKYDGCCSVITLYPDGSVRHQSRTGEDYPCLLGVAEELATAVGRAWPGHPGLVLIGEAWWPGEGQFSQISGEFRRLVRSPRLQFVYNDVLTLPEFEAGFTEVAYTARMLRMQLDKFNVIPLPPRVLCTTRRAAGTYRDPQALCNTLVDEGGYDGLILRDPRGTWTRGNGTTGEIVKIKRVLSFDLLVTGVTEGVGKHTGRMGAATVAFKGNSMSVGTGFTDQQRNDWHGPTSPLIGKIVEVEAMDISSHGVLREPRFKGVRFDKAAPDN